MTDYELKIVDAFTTRPFAGNPCAVVTRAGGLNDEQMQAMAREMNLSETAFVLPSSVADFRVRFFTPRAEIPLAGHPTIATMFTLADEGRIDLSSGPTRVTQELNVGILPVDLSRDAEGRVRVVMTQKPPEFPTPLPKEPFARALGIATSDLRDDVAPQVVSTGTPQAMIPVRSLEVLQQLRPNLQSLGELETAHGAFSTHVFALEAFEPPHRTHARHFAGNGGITEDPVTGSASGAMAAFLWRYGLLREPRYTIEQGHIMGRPGIIDIEVEGVGDLPTVVRIAGSAVTVLRGTLTV